MIEGETILLTGGAGFIGSTIAARFVERNRVRVYDTLSRNSLAKSPIANHPNLELIKGDVLDREATAAAMEGVDRVVHLASVAGVSTVLNQPVRTLRVAYEGTLHVLEAARRVDTIKRVITFSTSEVFGRYAYNVREGDETPIGPVGESRWTYAGSKIAAEHLAHAYFRQYGVPVVSLRPFNVYGPGQQGEGAIHNFIARALKEEPITVNNDGRQLRSWCYVSDMVDAVELSIERGEAIGEVFNVGNPLATVNVVRLAELVKRLTGSSSDIRFRRRDYTDVETRVPNIDKARELIGYEPQVSLEEGIEQTIAWYREHAGDE